MGLDILGHDFEESVASDNGKFILAWSDTAPDGMSGGARERGEGKYALLSGDMIIAMGNLQRPNDGKVSNQGSFILNDWMFRGAPIGTFYAFDPKGNMLIAHKFRANLGLNGISADGLYAVCQTYDADNQDGNKLAFFDLSKRVLVWKSDLIPGLAEDFRFDTANSILYLLYEKGREYRYDFKGNFLDGEKWEEHSVESAIEAKNLKLKKIGENIDSANGYEMLDLATETIYELEDKKADLASYDNALSLLKMAVDKGISDYYRARAHRILGEVLLKRGQRQEAIEHIEKALAADPKIGLKKLLAKLKSENQ